MKQDSSSQRKQITIISPLLGIGILILCSVLVFTFRGNILQLLTPVTPTVIPTMFIPTPDCGTPTLVIDSTTYQIQTITPATDGSLVAPADTSGIVYWVDGTDTNYVFVLSPTPENLSLPPPLAARSTAKVTWKNCNSTSYSLFAPESSSLNIPFVPEQLTSDITIYFQPDASSTSFIVHGEFTEEQIVTINTPNPGSLDVQAEISLLETTTSPDGTTIKVGVSILNYGGSAFTLSASDI